MFSARFVSLAIAAAVVMPLARPADAQTILPPLSVEAPAKRNAKKQALKKDAADAAAPSVGSDAALPGIVVEGEKVVRSLQATTTSIGVVTGQQIREEQIQDLQDALNTQANVRAPEGQRGNSGFIIRGLNSEGLTNNENPSAAPLISVVIDGATQNPEATRRGARGLWDVEQVEVLRGPQSTLQARNALGGTVFIRTNDPTYKWETILEGTTGDFGLQSGGFVVNAPIVAGQSALRIAGQSYERNHGIGYTNPANNDLDNDELRTLRGKLLLEPDSMPGLSALFTISHVHDKPAATAVTSPFFDRVLSLDPTDPFAFVDFRTTTASNYISDIGYNLAPGLTLRSVTAYADTETVIGSAAGSQIARDVTRTGGDFTQDLRIEIERRGNGLSGVLGVFYGSFKFKNDTLDTLLGLTIQDLITDTETESVAAYADLHYRFWNKFVAFGGGRLLRDEVRSTTKGSDAFTPLIDSSFSDTFTEALPRIGITYDLTPEQTVGVMYNKGYRNGFTERRLATGSFATVKPEYMGAYELSYRSTWLNKRLTLNGNIFYYDYTDQQVAFATDNPFLTSIVNADRSHAYGAEIEARWRPVPSLQLYGSLGLMTTEFDRFNAPTGDLGGNEFPNAPAYTIAAGALYKHFSGWFVGANVRHTDGYYSGFNGGDLANSALRFVDGYTTVDVRTGWEWGNHTLTVFAKNVFDAEYITSINTTGTEATVGDERLVGVTLRSRF
jgi:iron complex outermembrane recepter protein